MPLVENSYGIIKRLEFIKQAIRKFRPALVLDIGCGTGKFVTVPLAEEFCQIKFLGVDRHVETINFAKENNTLENLEFISRDCLKALARFDLIIASEVIEHASSPQDFILSLRESLNPGGKIVITLPNGFGPFEIVSLFERAFLKFRSRFFGNKERAFNRQNCDTFARSPHINFFSFRKVTGLMCKSGLRIIQYRGRTLFCGFGFDRLICNSCLIRWNSWAGDKLPAYLASGWMFLLEKERE